MLYPGNENIVGFNPRICKRCDLNLKIAGRLTIRFNPRICKRCDIAHGDFNAAAFSFNPRICKRCDWIPFMP